MHALTGTAMVSLQVSHIQVVDKSPDAKVRSLSVHRGFCMTDVRLYVYQVGLPVDVLTAEQQAAPDAKVRSLGVHREFCMTDVCSYVYQVGLPVYVLTVEQLAACPWNIKKARGAGRWRPSTVATKTTKKPAGTAPWRAKASDRCVCWRSRCGATNKCVEWYRFIGAHDKPKLLGQVGGERVP